MYRFDTPPYWDPRLQQPVADPRYHQPHPVMVTRPPVPQYITTTTRPHQHRSKSAHPQRSPERSNSKRRPAEEDPLLNWSEWRKSINNDLSRDLVRNTYRPIPVGKEFDKLVRPASKSKRGVYQYASTIDQATQLHKEDFINFGIPRAQITQPTPKREVRRQSSSSNDSDSDESEVPFYSINRLSASTHRGPHQYREPHQYKEPHQYREHQKRKKYRDSSEEMRRRSHREYRHVSPEIIIEDRRHRSHR